MLTWLTSQIITLNNMSIVIMKWVLQALMFLIISHYVEGFSVDSFGFALFVAFFMGVVSVTIRPIIMLFALPLNVLTLGLFAFVINALLLLLVSGLLDGFEITGFGPAFVGALLLSFGGTLISFISNKISK